MTATDATTTDTTAGATTATAVTDTMPTVAKVTAEAGTTHQRLEQEKRNVEKLQARAAASTVSVRQIF